MQRAEIVPLHSSLGNNSETLSQKKKKKRFHMSEAASWWSGCEGGMTNGPLEESLVQPSRVHLKNLGCTQEAS